MELKITCIPGDGIGPEIVSEAKKVLDAVAKKYGHTMNYTDILMGGASIDGYGVPLTDEAIQTARDADAVLMGSIGGNTTTSPWYKLPPNLRPEAGLLALRKALNLFANLRPAVLYEELAEACPLKEEISSAGFDMLIMRELTGGLYFGERKTIEENGVMKAIDTLTYDENEIRRIAIKGFDIAMKRRKKVTSVDKANVLDSSRLWRKVVEEVAKDYPEVTFIVWIPPYSMAYYDTENMRGKLLKDMEAVEIELGMLSEVSNIEAYCFMDRTDWILNLDRYKDVQHYDAAMNDEIMNAIAKGEGRITKDNVHEYMEGVRKLYLEFDYDSIYE